MKEFILEKLIWITWATEEVAASEYLLRMHYNNNILNISADF